MKILSLALLATYLVFFASIFEVDSKILDDEPEIESHYYNHHRDGTVTWNYGKKSRRGKGNSAKSVEDKHKCQDNSPYCLRFVKAYGLNPPFTICDKDWFITANGKYGCRESCGLC